MARHFGAVAVGRHYLEVAAAALGRLEDRLAAAAARRDDARAGQLAARADMAAGDRDAGDPVEPERLLGRGQRGNLGADAEPEAGILHVRPERNLAVHGFDRAADAEAGI